MRYLSQRYSMPYPQVQALLTDIGTEGSELHSPPAASTRFRAQSAGRSLTGPDKTEKAFHAAGNMI